jgi:hypothetical protein
MNTTNHTSPSGEDAANGATDEFGIDECIEALIDAKSLAAKLSARNQLDLAIERRINAAAPANVAIGEREAFEAWGNETFNYGFQPETWDDGAGPVAREAQYTHEGTQMAWEGWQARAALTAEKVAAEPVAYTTADRLKRIAERNRHVDTMWPASMRDEGDIALYAAPQQPAQSAEQDERAAFVSGRDVEELFLRWSEWTTELGEAISRKNIDGFISDLRALLGEK